MLKDPLRSQSERRQASFTVSKTNLNNDRSSKTLQVLRGLLLSLTLDSALHAYSGRRLQLKHRRAGAIRNAEVHSVSRLPFYTDPELNRDRSRVLQVNKDNDVDVLTAASSRFVLSQSGKIFHLPATHGREEAEAIFLSPEYIDPAWLKAVTEPGRGGEVIWVGSKHEIDFFALDLPPDLAIAMPEFLREQGATANPVRQFADTLASREDAAVLASANGLINFHRSHPFCAKCGSATFSDKLGGCRRCSNPECRASFYPRIDPSAIMLVVSPNEIDGGAHALLGRKKSWPAGRYSTLAGFAEVGESMEECCVREVLEESGVRVDLHSVRFVASQPWPFPRSLMVGFRAQALAPKGSIALPAIDSTIDELEDVQWFSRDYVRRHLQGGSTALEFEPTAAEAEFHIPGKASLARKLISEWALEES